MHPDQDYKPSYHQGIPNQIDTPISLYWGKKNQTLYLKWLRSNRIEIRQPFFDGDIESVIESDLKASIYQTKAKALLRYSNELKHLKPPKAYIFHISHCGSTLTSQLFGCLPNTIVFSEAKVISRALLMVDHWDREEVIALLRNLLPVLGHACLEDKEEGNYCVKFSSWSILFFDLIMDAFPEVPSLFLYRDPKEIMAPLMQKCISRNGLFKSITQLHWCREQMGYGDRNAVSKEAECAQLLDIYLQAFLQCKDRFEYVLEYPELKDRMIPVIEGIMEQVIQKDTLGHIAEVISRNAKAKGNVTFHPDSQDKLDLLTSPMLAKLEQTASRSYDRIQAWRETRE